MRSSRHLLSVLLVLLFCAILAGCGGHQSSAPSSGQTRSIVTHTGFYWLPPIVHGGQSFTGTFDPSATVEVQIQPEGGGAPFQTFYMSGAASGSYAGSSETIRVVPDEGCYVVNWHTNDPAVWPWLNCGQTYRIVVIEEGFERGHADCQIFRDKGEAKNVDTGEIVPLVDLQTLPIKFRLETERPRVPWPTLQHDMRRTGRTSLLGPQTPTLRWVFQAGDTVWGAPAVGADGTVYVGSRDRYLYALNPDGTEKWRFLTGGSVASDPTIGPDLTIYVGSNDACAYAVNPDGTEKWRCPTGGKIYSSPALSQQGTLYVVSMDNSLYAINPDGSQKWRFPTDGDVSYSAPALASDGTVYVGDDSGTFYAVNADGTEKWRKPWCGAITSAVAVADDGVIYVMGVVGYPWDSVETYLWAFAPDGTETGRLLLPEGHVGSAVPLAIAFDGTVYLGTTHYSAEGSQPYLFAITPAPSMGVKWSLAISGFLQSPPVVGGDGTIYVAIQEKAVVALAPDGTEKWRFATDARVLSNLSIGTDQTLYVGCSGGKVYAIGP